MNLRKPTTIKLSLTEQFRYNLHTIAKLKIDLHNHSCKDSYFKIELVKNVYKIHTGLIIYAWKDQYAYLNKDISKRIYAKIITISPTSVFFNKSDELIVPKPHLGVYYISDDGVVDHTEYNIYTYWEVIKDNEDTI